LKIVFVLNTFKFFYSHRIEIGKKLLESGYEVHILASGKKMQELKKLGFILHEYINPKPTLNPYIELASFISIFKALKKINPDILHLITLKPYIYGGIINRLFLKKPTVISVAGLGLIVSKGLKASIIKYVVIFFMKLSFKQGKLKVIVQNNTDKNFLTSNKICESNKIILIKGSGVDLAKYTYSDENTDKFICTFASRLIVEKGVNEFIEAANNLDKFDMKFWIVGDQDPNNNNSISIEDLMIKANNPNIHFLGHRSDINEIFKQSNIIVYPSYYGEGLPKVLIEAAACGRPIITTNHPGCKDAIDNMITGYLCPIRDSVSIVKNILLLYRNDIKRKEFGRAARKFAEANFDVSSVVKKHIEIYQSIKLK